MPTSTLARTIKPSIPRLLQSLLIAIFLTACSPPEEKEADASLRVESAQAHFDKGQFNAAIIETRSALQLEPGNEAANLLLARVFLELGLTRQSIDVLERIDSDSTEYYSLLVDAYLDRGKFGSALLLMRDQPSHFPRLDPNTFVLEARARAGLRDLKSASSSVEQALRLNPQYLPAQIQKTRTIAMRGDLELAEIRINELLATHPDNIELMTLLAAIYVRYDRLDEAEALLTEIIFALPSTDLFTKQRVNIIRNMIRLLAHQGRSSEALIYQQMLTEAFPASEQTGQQIMEALAKVESRNYGSAVKLLEELEDSAPGNPTSGTLRGIIAYLEGDHALAEEQFIKYVDPEVANEQQLRAFAANQFALNRPHQVVEILKRRADVSSNPNTLALFGIAAISADRRGDGMTALKKAVNLDPDNHRLAIIHARFLFDENPEAALQSLVDLYTRAPGNVEVWQALAQEYARQEKHNKAVEYTSELVEQNPDQFVAHILKGSALLKVERFDESETAFRSSIELLTQGNIVALFGLASVSVSRQDWGAARELYREIIELDPESTFAYDRLLMTYLVEDRAQEGINILSDYATRFELSAPVAAISAYLATQENSAQLDQYLSMGNRLSENREWRSTSATIHFTRARQELADRNYGKARVAVFSALTSFPANRFLLALLAEIEMASGSLDEAQKVIEQIRQFHPGSHTLFASLGDLAVAQSKPAEALSHYRTAWDISASDIIAQKIYENQIALNATEDATAFLQEWIVKIPDSVVARINEAQETASKGDSPGAIRRYEKMLEQHPDSISIQNNLAWLYIENNQTDAGLALAESAYRAMPTMAEVLDTYGWALFRNGELTRSRELLMKSLAIDDNAETRRRLQMVEAALQSL